MKKRLFIILLICLSVASLSQETWIEEAKKEIKAAATEEQRIKATSELFWTYVYSYPDSALPYAQQSMLAARKIKSDSAFSVAYQQLSTHASLTGNYPLALQYAFEALRFGEHTGNFMVIASNYIVVTDVYLAQGDYKRAVLYAEKGKDIFDAHFKMPATPPIKKDTSTDYGSTLYKLAEAYERNGQLDSALKLIPVIQFVWSYRKVTWPTVFYIYGNIYRKKGNYLKATGYYHQGIQSSIHYGIKKDLMDNYTALANTFKIIHQWDSCIYYSNKVLETSKAAKYPIAQMKAIELLAGSYKAKNNIDSTAKYFEMALAAKDSLFNQEKLTQLQNLAFNEQLRQQEIQEQQQKRLYRYRLYVSFGGLLVLAIIAFILYRSNVQKQNARIKIEKAYTELKSTQAQLIQSEKMASLGELTAGIAHEIQNPLNFVNNFAEANTELIDELEAVAEKGHLGEVRQLASDIRENEQKIAYHGRRADSIVKGMLQHARASTGKKEPTDINQLVDEYLRLSFQGFRAKNKEFTAAIQTNFDESVGEIEVIPQDIGRVLLNLFNNAFYAVHQKKQQINGPYEPMVSVHTKRNGSNVQLIVHENGTGMPQKIAEKVFQPFFTTKPTGEGTGLGLSLSYDIVTKGHGGSLSVTSKEGEGSEFVVQLPIK